MEVLTSLMGEERMGDVMGRSAAFIPEVRLDSRADARMPRGTVTLIPLSRILFVPAFPVRAFVPPHCCFFPRNNNALSNMITHGMLHTQF